MMIDFLCNHMMDDDEVSMSILVFIRELSFRLNKVLDSKLEPLLGALYNLHWKTNNEALRKETVYTLRTLAKYSSDIKFLYYITLMPEQMFTKFKLCNAYCMNFILQKENLNILVLEEDLLIALIKLSSELFADAHKVINDLGEEIVVNLFKRFMERKKADSYLKLIKIHINKKRAEQLLRFLKLNFENIEEIVKVSEQMQAYDLDEVLAEKNLLVPSASKGSVFGRNAMALLEDASDIASVKSTKKKVAKKPPAESMKALGKRDHNMQEMLMQEINQLISGG